jgi:pilus assembly protein Flp/PilA
MGRRLFNMMARFKAFLNDERGQASTEYGVIVGLIAIGIIVAVTALRDEIAGVFQRAGTALSGMNP